MLLLLLLLLSVQSSEVGLKTSKEQRDESFVASCAAAGSPSTKDPNGQSGYRGLKRAIPYKGNSSKQTFSQAHAVRTGKFITYSRPKASRATEKTHCPGSRSGSPHDDHYHHHHHHHHYRNHHYHHHHHQQDGALIWEMDEACDRSRRDKTCLQDSPTHNGWLG